MNIFVFLNIDTQQNIFISLYKQIREINSTNLTFSLKLVISEISLYIQIRLILRTINIFTLKLFISVLSLFKQIRRLYSKHLIFGLIWFISVLSVYKSLERYIVQILTLVQQCLSLYYLCIGRRDRFIVKILYLIYTVYLSTLFIQID